jgi:aminoglycoside 3-N-acetyltransferase
VSEVTAGRITDDLRGLGVRTGQVLLVHASLRQIGHVQGGAETVVSALRAAVGTGGTVVVPAATSGNSDTSRTHLERICGLTAAERDRFRAGMPAFDPARTPSTGMGRVAECVRCSAGAVRSAHPQTSFAAVGPLADQLMRGHAPDCHLGEESPLARLAEVNAHILLLGVGYASCTAFHLAEYRYHPNPPTREYRCVVDRNGRAQWWGYRDVVLDDGDFAELGGALDQTEQVRRGTVGAADTRLIPLPEAVDFAAGWLARTRR